MAAFLQRLQENRKKKRASKKPQTRAGQAAVVSAAQSAVQPMDIAPNDPLIAYFLSSPVAVEVDRLQLASPTLKALKEAGVKLTIPLVSQGELVGLINLGGRMSEQDYSSYDKGLLNSLATQAAPALRVAQMVLEQQAQARERERIEQELRIARIIQQTLLPKELPDLPGWQLSTFYQPARAVGGDFYDFIPFEDGRLGLVVGDVTDKGVPAALVMATTRSILRSSAQENQSPGVVLERANDLLFPDIPPRMFVTCFYAILDPRSGTLQYANAGHDLPYRWRDGEVAELRATGMPLGLMPGMQYEEKEAILEPGESILLYSDGLVEAHNPARDMFGFPRLITLLGTHESQETTIDYLRHELSAFVGEDWEQEDDITLVTLERAPAPLADQPTLNLLEMLPTALLGGESDQQLESDQAGWQVVQSYLVPSAPGNERLAMSYVAEAVKPFHLPERRLDQLGTAVAEATMNAMEHGNHYNPELPVTLQVRSSDQAIAVRISDKGGTSQLPTPEEYEAPNIEAKLAELQSPRGWGLFLIQNMVDEMHVLSNEENHTIELILRLEGDNHAHQNA
ncbi:MAG TPA: SpoIIE family protein phosphatase [Ktedonobacteraceae bacterium]|nr:SpoIIE family protein phosphatase [Ktedonobacteraceae bacterium]